MPTVLNPLWKIDVFEDLFLLLVNSLSTLSTGRLVFIVNPQSN